MLTGHAFISYSRKDYYFAESLALHLLGRGVKAWLDVKDLTPGVDWERDLVRAVDEAAVVLLVASPAAMASPHVRLEWQRALEQGKRIVVLRWFRRVRLPEELRGCESVDFRGRFGVALSRLLRRLATDDATPHEGSPAHWLPRLPPAVAAAMTCLALPIVGYALVVAPHTRLDAAQMTGWGMDAAAQGALLILFAFGLVWGLCLSLAQRRMGMTRLLGCLCFVAAPYALALGKLGLAGPAALGDMDPGIARTVTEHWRLGLAFAAFPLAGMLLLVAVRPGDLLRWMPTGKVWPLYRRPPGGRPRAEPVDAADAFARAGTHRLLHDAPDAPAAARLRDELAQAGAVAAQADDRADTTVLLVTSETGIVWLERQSQQLASRPLLVVIGSAIALPEALAWLWKRQWIDFRRWDLRRSGQVRGLPAVPEAVGSPQLPAPVAQVHRLLCAFGALLFVLGGVLQPEHESQAMSAAELVGVGAALCGLAMLNPARGLLRRSMPAARFERRALWLAVAGAALGASALACAVAVHGAGWRVAAGMLALVALPLAALRRRRDIAFWLPQPAGGNVSSMGRLMPAGSWRSVGVFALFALGWMLLLDPSVFD